MKLHLWTLKSDLQLLLTVTKYYSSSAFLPLHLQTSTLFFNAWPHKQQEWGSGQGPKFADPWCSSSDQGHAGKPGTDLPTPREESRGWGVTPPEACPLTALASPNHPFLGACKLPLPKTAERNDSL